MLISRTLAALIAAGALACSSAPKPTPVTPGTGTTSGQTGDGQTAAVPTPYKSGPPQKVTAVEGITEYHLDNGMRVLLFPDQSQEKVTVNITYFVGSRHEGYGEAGMAHLLEHMVFKGTPDHPNIWKMLQDHGAQFNGTTWYDRTNYYETLPATEENLAFALGMEADRMVNSTIAADQLAKEFSVVRNEFEMGENNPQGVLEERIVSAAYLWHNYGKSTIGNRSDIERVPAENLRAFYKKYYRPDNAMLIVAGKFDEAKALEMIHDKFGVIPKPDTALAKTYTVEPVQDGERTVILRRAGDAQYVGVLYHGLPGAHVDAPSLDAAGEILTDEPSGALYKQLVEKKLATKVWYAAYPTREPGYVMFWAEVPKTVKLEQVRDKLIDVVEGFADEGPSAAEVKRYVRRGDKMFEQLMSNSQRAAITLTEFAAIGDWRMLHLSRDRLADITPANVKRVAGQFYKRSNRTVGLFYPTNEKIDRAPVVEQPDVVAMVDGYKGREQMSEGEAFAATFANVENRTDRVTLKGGMQLALLPKKTRGENVEAQILINYGSERDLKGKMAAAELVPEMLMRGTKSMSYQQIRDRLDELKATVNLGVRRPGQAVVTISTKREQLPAVLELVGQILTQPSFPKDQFEIVKREQLTQLESQLQDPQALAINRLQQTLNPYPKTDVRYVPTIPEQIARLKKVNLGQIKSLHKTLWGASNAQAAVVGDFDADEIKGALDTHLGSWKNKKKYVRIANKYKQNAGGEEVIQTPDKQMAFIIAAKTLKLRDDHPDYAALNMVGYIMGGGASSRLLNRLRQKEGLSYGAFGGVQAGSLDELGAIFGGAILAPQNAEKGMAMMLEEMSKLLSEGAAGKELEDAKAAFIKQRKTMLANDKFIASKLADALYVGRTLQFEQEMNSKVKALTAADLKKAIAAHLSADGLMRIKAGDFAAEK